MQSTDTGQGSRWALSLIERDIKRLESERDYWMEYAFRLEEESGAALHRPKRKRDKNVTRTCRDE